MDFQLDVSCLRTNEPIDFYWCAPRSCSDVGFSDFSSQLSEEGYRPLVICLAGELGLTL